MQPVTQLDFFFDEVSDTNTQIQHILSNM